ncbi:transcriptional regulator BolA [Bartonella clarridgeiae 73]|uniref:Transcriptional regulator BolA n=1 Tax=Bartonella clarridgeiae (strain CCUG 45776 / CIP 104772 / 73) TaxID=696125 RepID=E6YJE1_BARC7|nr:BolA family protein [Bartonella clarridgeiae]WCR55787.1 MAG: Cell division protein BolA [Bartonella clarridgeiae]CBI76979.1 transcriptional regulator BolA [Bartonella clarridgeiae 73]
MSRTIQIIIETKLRDAFFPQKLEVINESHLHAGHRHDEHAFDGKGETHFRVKMLSSAFSGMKRVEIHRAIYKVLQQELVTNIHALALEIEGV